MIRVLKAVLRWHWYEIICNPYHWLSQLAALVVFFTINAATGLFWLAFVASIIAILLTPCDRPYREWRQERIAKRWQRQQLAEQERIAEESAALIRSRGHEARVERTPHGPVLVANYVDRLVAR